MYSFALKAYCEKINNSKTKLNQTRKVEFNLLNVLK